MANRVRLVLALQAGIAAACGAIRRTGACEVTFSLVEG